MYQLRYLTYLILSVVGGCILKKMFAQSDIFVNATWLMTGNVLFELLEWKYNQQENNNEI